MRILCAHPDGLPPSFLNCQKDPPMEDADSDTEMVDYGTDFSDDVDPNFDEKALVADATK